MSPRSLDTCVLSQSTRIVRNHFETEDGFEAFVAVLGMAKTKFLQASMESLLVSTLHSSER